jgi:threonyl-tRNA synthetase
MSGDSTQERPAGIPADYDEQLYRIRHSAAHVLAEAVRDQFDGEVRFGIGPPIDEGFYYDFELPRSLTDEDLPAIEARMREIINGSHEFAFSAIDRAEARQLFADQPFKLELIENLEAGQTDDNGEPLEGAEEITTYTQDDFTDLCRGPHVESTAEIPAFKLLSIAGAYWRGDERRPMLQRIYGTAFKSEEELELYLTRREEAERRDHRKLGRELELFHLDRRAPGMPYWLPKGLKLFNALVEFWREEHEERGYQEISSPLINEKSLWDQSGHWEHYKDNMFVIPVDENTTYGVKPMNCPNAMVVFNLNQYSYRDLPLRLSDCDVLHRHERSGVLHGLLRVQKFSQDDAHIFCAEDEIEEEYRQIFEICKLFYGLFDLNYKFRLGTRPEGFIGDRETWDKAEAALTRILDEHVGRDGYWIEEGDGAFYGPKVDIMMEDALGREWQMGTIQLDFQLPRRFDCTYIDNEDKPRTPVVIHRVIYGSLERFIGILIEHTAGAFPPWLAPVQAQVIPITDDHVEGAQKIAKRLREARIRAVVDDGDRRMGAKIRRAELQKVPWMLVLGNRELESDTVSLRLRSGEQPGSMPVEEFVDYATGLIKERANV